jgi:chorismate mutase
MIEKTMQQQLELHRANVLKINLDLIHLIKERRQVVNQIQSIKIKEGNFPYFDVEREKKLYAQLSNELIKLTLKEIFSLSLLVESQADPDNDQSYPHFSNGDHLLDPKKPLELFEQINPILLYYYDPKYYQQLKLKPFFIIK